MSHSNSSLNCFASCMAKYKHRYILYNEPKSISPHLTFGAMAHEVLYKAGILRDEQRDGVSTDEYKNIIPSELLYPELKSEFNIKSWNTYFVPIIKQVEKYEKDCIEEILRESNVKDCQIEREIKLQLTVDQLKQLGYYKINQPFVGIIDLLITTPTHAIILDYKFSTKRKTQNNFDMDSQLPLYSFMIHTLYDIPLHNIQYGYIDIPKTCFEQPVLLSTGKLSKSKSLNISQELFEKAVKVIHEDDEYYNCKPGGYYYDAWCNYGNNKAAYLSKQWLDVEVYENVTEELFSTASLIDVMIDNNLPMVQKYDAYTCQGCEYVDYCKPYLKEVF